MRTLGNLFICIGILLLLSFSYLVRNRFSPNTLSFDNYKAVSSGESFGSSPVYIEIEEQNIKLPIYHAEINKGSWSAVDNGVSYLSSTPRPGSVGNSILYGHNWTNLLGKLVNVKPGQKVKVVFDNGEIKKFEVYFTQIVKPSDVELLEQDTNERILTIYTCTGFLDRERFVAVSEYIETI